MAQDTEKSRPALASDTDDAEAAVDDSDALCCNACDECSCADCLCSRPQWRLAVDALFLTLDDPENQPVVRNRFNNNATLLSTDSVDLGTQAGLRTQLLVPLNCAVGFEAIYFGLNDWSSATAVNGVNSLSVPGSLGSQATNFFAADRMELRYGAEINNVEFNLRRQLANPNWFALGGFRYLNYTEDFGLRTFKAIGFVSDYTIGTENNLFGGQLGGGWQRQYRRFGLEITGKAGIFGNNATQGTFVGDFSNTFAVRAGDASNTDVAFVGDLSFVGSYQLTRSLYLRGGYNLLWIDNVARAADQLDFTNSVTVNEPNTDGNAFLHGANAGLEVRW